MKKFKFMAILTLLLATIFSSVTVVYAWIVIIDNTDSMSFTAAAVASRIIITKGLDNNQDGILEFDGTNDRFDEKTKLDSLYLTPNKDNIKVFTDALMIKNAMPTEIHTWKVEVENNGDVTCDLVFNIVYNVKSLMKVFSISTSYGDGNTITTTPKAYFGVQSNNILEYKTGLIVPTGNKATIMIKMEFEVLDVLIANNIKLNDDSALINNTEYQAYQGQSLTTADTPIIKIFLQK
ncbi:MAG: hypothetical protein RR054_04055 [Clostridia bacterium]